ncbi:MAG: DUF3795 domain-containing protein [Clostridia bacterium]|nr:DUF3795 domain-containing protein [Clostridia bacterium]
MKWYIERSAEMESFTPIYSVCGDDCAVCPRYLARTEQELQETAVFWKKTGWRDHVMTNEETRCHGCGTRGTCSFMLLPCIRTHQVKSCKECSSFPCTKIDDMLARSLEKQEQCRKACENETEYSMLCRAYYEKEKNLREKPCCDSGE